ncbi:hypothetical protein [Escherichia coli]|uniref:hypothetical protein n=1 Tax=Escherichia coli TaxID=562 RepID=UPI00191AE2EF|nr:hypothetical protein [Escherichia coli]CAD6107092.1 Uncharacterised protein [Escherichia coli]CAD6111314.1 Uncharacterised protein [Escherichia coli]CAD6181099.1 Uncharacterised protein [Escherichia coli]
MNKLMINKLMVAGALLTVWSACHAEELAAQRASTTVAVVSGMTFSHTLTGQTITAGKVAANAVVAQGEVNVNGAGNFRTVTLAWDRATNPTGMYLSDHADTAIMYADGQEHKESNAVYVHFEPKTPVSSVEVEHKTAAIYDLSTPSGVFKYSINLGWQQGGAGSPDELYSGNYQLAVSADVIAA